MIALRPRGVAVRHGPDPIAVAPVIVGAGPAGIRAAEALVEAGVRPAVVDEAPRWGGQIYRQPPHPLAADPKTLYGADARRAERVLGRMRALLPQIDYRPDTQVWNIDRDGIWLRAADGGIASLPRDGGLILATGASDRVLPVPGWTLPGVYTLGGTQAALKGQGLAVGRRIVLTGSSPLLYLVAWQLTKAGAHVVAVLDEGGLSDRLAALPHMIAMPGMLARGLYYIAKLRLAGVTVHEHVRLDRIEGRTGVEAVTCITRAGKRIRIACDSVGIGHGLRSETQLADLAGCAFRFDAGRQDWVPESDAVGRSSAAGVYVAGDGAGVTGGIAAEHAGRLAANALLADAGLGPARVRVPWTLRRARRFATGVQRAFPVRDDWASNAPDDLVVCRCEGVRASDIRAAGLEKNRTKALTRTGMGRCQGRFCDLAASLLLAEGRQACQPQGPGRLRGQSPVRPVSLGDLAAQTRP